MNRKWLGLITVFILLMATVLGCGNPAVNQTVAESGSDSQPQTLGEEKTSQKPERIVSVTLGTDEILLALVDKSRLLAVTKYSEDPGISNVAGQTDDIPHKIQSANVEQIIALEPDLVYVASYTNQDVVKQLQDAGLTVAIFEDFNTIQSIIQNIVTVGEQVGEVEKAKQIVAEMEQRLAAIDAKVANIAEENRPRVLTYTPDGYTAGMDTLSHDMITRAGGINAAAEAGLKDWVQISLEKIVELDPEVILVSDWNPGHPDFAESLQQNPALQSVSALKNNRIVSVSGAHLTAVTQYIVNGVEDVFNVIHQ